MTGILKRILTKIFGVVKLTEPKRENGMVEAFRLFLVELT